MFYGVALAVSRGMFRLAADALNPLPEGSENAAQVPFMLPMGQVEGIARDALARLAAVRGALPPDPGDGAGPPPP